MTIGEFKAFLEGTGVQEAPTLEQWARIKEKIEALEGWGGGLPNVPPGPTTDPNSTGYPPNKWPIITCENTWMGEASQ